MTASLAWRKARLALHSDQAALERFRPNHRAYGPRQWPQAPNFQPTGLKADSVRGGLDLANCRARSSSARLGFYVESQSFGIALRRIPPRPYFLHVNYDRPSPLKYGGSKPAQGAKVRGNPLRQIRPNPKGPTLAIKPPSALQKVQKDQTLSPRLRALQSHNSSHRHFGRGRAWKTGADLLQGHASISLLTQIIQRNPQLHQRI